MSEPYIEQSELNSQDLFKVELAMRLRECAVHADYAHVREYADAAENLIHINHT